MPSRFVEVTGTLDEYDLHSTLRRWPQWNVSGVSQWLVEARNTSALHLPWNFSVSVALPDPVNRVLDRAPPKLVSWMFLAALLLFVVQSCMVGCHRRHLLKAYAHAKRL